jgi:hypothetical protein
LHNPAEESVLDDADETRVLRTHELTG